jgi:hypothetical protein
MMRNICILLELLSLLLLCLIPWSNAQENKLPGYYVLCLKQPNGMELPDVKQCNLFLLQLRTEFNRFLTIYDVKITANQLAEGFVGPKEVTHVIYYWLTVKQTTIYQVNGGVALKNIVNGFVQNADLLTETADNSENDDEKCNLDKAIKNLAQKLVKQAVPKMGVPLPPPIQPEHEDRTGNMLWYMIGLGILVALLLTSRRLICNVHVQLPSSIFQKAATTFYRKLFQKIPSQPQSTPQPQKTAISSSVRPTLPSDYEYPDGGDDCKLGMGGQAEVYLVYDKKMQRFAAAKFLAIGNSTDYQRFLREIKVLAGLKHPNIVTMYTYSVDTKLSPWYFIMEYLSEGSLADRIHKNNFPLEERLTVLKKIALAVDFVHRQYNKTIIHRDIKPANILFDSNGEPKLIDFGLAKDNGQSSLTMPG